MILNELSYRIIGIAMRVHSELGPGLCEEVYEAAMVVELTNAGHAVRQQVSIPIEIGDKRIPKAARSTCS